MTVCLGVLDVDLLVSHIQVATEDHRLLRIESLQIAPEVVLPRHTVVETLQAVL